MHENEHYKGRLIPNLPEKKLIGNLDPSFIDKRREELETFLREISKHEVLKYDTQLKAFLTIADFDSYRSNPSAYERVLGMYEYLPSVRDISLNSI